MADVLFVSDTHFENFAEFATPDASPEYPGCNSRMLRILEAFMRAVSYAIAHGITTIFIPGDVFHRRGIINVPVFNAVSKVFDQAQKNGVKVYVMAGNHDVVDRHGRQAYDGLHALYAMGTAVVFNEPVVSRLGVHGKTPWCVIPFTSSREQWMAEAQKLIASSGRFDRPPIIIAHQSFDGAVTGPHEFIMREGINPATDIPKECQGVVSGHYHKHQAIVAPSPVIYVGGLVQHNFGERTYTPGWMVYYEEKDKFEHIEDTGSPRFVVMETDSVADVTKFQEDSKILGNYYRVDWTGQPEMLTKLASESSSSVSLRQVMPEGATPVRISFAGYEGIGEILSRYVNFMEEAKRLPEGISKEALLEVGQKFLVV